MQKLWQSFAGNRSVKEKIIPFLHYKKQPHLANTVSIVLWDNLEAKYDSQTKSEGQEAKILYKFSSDTASNS